MIVRTWGAAKTRKKTIGKEKNHQHGDLGCADRDEQMSKRWPFSRPLKKVVELKLIRL